MRIIALIAVGTVCLACSTAHFIAGEYSGSSTLRIVGGPKESSGSVSMGATITGRGEQFIVETRICRIIFDVVATGLATVASGSSCTIDPELYGGVRFNIGEGDATFDDGTIGITLAGRSLEGDRLQWTYAGVKR